MSGEHDANDDLGVDMEERKRQREERRKQREAEMKALDDEQEKERLKRKRAREERMHKQKCEMDGVPYVPLYPEDLVAESNGATPHTQNVAVEAARAPSPPPANETPEERERREKIEAAKLRQAAAQKEEAAADAALAERDKLLRDRLAAPDSSATNNARTSYRANARTSASDPSTSTVHAVAAAAAPVKSPRVDEGDDDGAGAGVLFKKYTAVKEELETATARLESMKEKLAQKDARIVDLESEAMTKDAKIKEQERLLNLTLEKMKKLEERLATAQAKSPELIAAEAIERERAERAEREAADKKRKAEEAAAAAAAAEAAKAAERAAQLAKVAESAGKEDESDESDKKPAAATHSHSHSHSHSHAHAHDDDDEDADADEDDKPATTSSRTSKTSKKDKGSSSDKPEKKKSDKGDKGDKGDKASKSKGSKGDKADKAEKADKADKLEKADSKADSKKSDKKEKGGDKAAAEKHEATPDKAAKPKKSKSSKEDAAPAAAAADAEGSDDDDGASLGAPNDGESVGDGFVQADIRLYADFLNNTLATDEHVGMELPVGLDGPDFLRLVSNGIAPCKLLSKLVPNSVPDGDLTFIVTDDDDRRDNLQLCVDCARQVGCDVSGIDIAGVLKLKPSAVLGLVWALLRAPLVKEMSGNATARKLAGVGKSSAPLTNDHADEALLAWANVHVTAAGGTAAENLASDWADGERYEQLLQAAAPQVYASQKRALRRGATAGGAARLAALVAAFEALGAPSLVAPRALANGAPRQHWVQLAALFCAEPLANKK
jgi:hypothetical protein